MERERIQHFSHSHELFMFTNEEQSDEIKEAMCFACLESLSFGSRFSCEKCNFHLHKRCADAPLEIRSSSFHPQHPSLALHSSLPTDWSYICDLCKEKRKNMFVYICSSCNNFWLDLKCALLLHDISIDEDFRELKHFAHEEHQLSLIENPPKDIDQHVVQSGVDCFWCQKPLVDYPASAYACLQCKSFYLHKKCAKLPSQLHHPCHRIHPFIVEFSEKNLFCKVCQSEDRWEFFFRCSPCKLDIHIKCAFPPLIIEDRHHHEHPFLRLFKNDVLFTCNACGTVGYYVSYICLKCNFQVHQNCTSLPHIIKITRHHHNIIHKYFLEKKEFDEKQECQLCLEQVKAEHGNYSCSRQDCDFLAHVRCAMEMHMYNVVDDQANDQDDEESASITCVIEWNEDRKAAKIKHFSHDHELTLGNKIELEDGDKLCDGCMVSISSTWYYSCSQCEFLLHKTCAELPRKKHLWFHQPLTTLEPVDLFRCDQCNRYNSGFVYKSKDGKFCLRCARTSHTFSFTNQGHKHFLFFDFNFRGECNGCGKSCSYGAFKCKDCSSAFDFRCITLPETTRHKCDKHSLRLAFHEENDDPEQHCCHVCEQDRDPKLWFYHCAICDNAAHPECILGEFSFVKMGVSVAPYRYPLYHGHRHPLIFAKKDYEKCSKCERRFQDEVAIECKNCNHVIHPKCFAPWLF